MCMVRGQGTDFLPSLSSLFFFKVAIEGFKQEPWVLFLKTIWLIQPERGRRRFSLAPLRACASDCSLVSAPQAPQSGFTTRSLQPGVNTGLLVGFRLSLSDAGFLVYAVAQALCLRRGRITMSFEALDTTPSKKNTEYLCSEEDALGQLVHEKCHRVPGTRKNGRWMRFIRILPTVTNSCCHCACALLGFHFLLCKMGVLEPSPQDCCKNAHFRNHKCECVLKMSLVPQGSVPSSVK